jgi:hypothetical protein
MEGKLGWSQSGQIRGSTGSEAVRQSNRVHFAALLCLIAVFAQFFLPIAHTAWHITKDIPIPLCKDIACSGSGGRNEATTPKLTSTARQTEHSHHHDPSTCSLCQSLQHSSSFVVPHYSPTSSVPTIVGLLSADCSDTYTSACNLNGCGPRAPPCLS